MGAGAAMKVRWVGLVAMVGGVAMGLDRIGFSSGICLEDCMEISTSQITRGGQCIFAVSHRFAHEALQ